MSGAVQLEGTHNFRDTGGTPLAGGGATRAGTLYRSDALSTLTATGLDQLAASDIGVVADFRTPLERGMAPNRLPETRALRTVEMPLLEGAMTGLAQQAMGAASKDAAAAAIGAALAQLPSLGDMYVSMLGHGAPTFAGLARLVAAATADPPTAVLVHCTAGKDRTGVAIALLLDAVGADRSAIVADYAASAANLAGPWADGMRATVERFGAPMTPELDALLTATPPAAIEQAFAWLDSEHGGSVSYLRSGGATPAEIDALGERLAG